MTTSTGTTTPAAADNSIQSGAFLLPWIGRGLEGLWILAVFLVPLAFLSKDYVISEAEISYVEVPKVALLRLLAGMIALLWLIEWAIKSRAFQSTPTSFNLGTIAGKFKPHTVFSASRNWLIVHPIRWLLFAAGLFYGSTLLSTVLSGSPSTSVWGEIPGQDGYSAYTVASYAVLFGVIATHLRDVDQLARLLGAVILMGVFVGLYGTFQHYGHDFFEISELSGGGALRTTVFMGNAIFAGAVLSMTVPVTLVAAATTIRDVSWGDSGPLSRLRQLEKDWVLTVFWASVLGIQLLGLMFTLSRGPWSGAVLALAAFLGLLVLALGFRVLVKAGLVIGLAGLLAGAVLHWQGDVSIINVGSWLSLVIVLLSLAAVYSTLFLIQNFGRMAVLISIAGAFIVILVAAVFGPSAISYYGKEDIPEYAVESVSAADQVTDRISSIGTDVVGGFVGGRGTHWKVSWDLIKNRPWFDFDELHLAWLRPIIGYGPDLFRYIYLTESPPEEPDFSLLEPDHAHNFFIHQTVEQGLFGGIASLALFATVFGIVGHHLVSRRRSGSSLYRLLLIGLMAVILGRFLEMMVGVARISDLTILWVVFALFAALIRFDGVGEEGATAAQTPTPQTASRRERRRAARALANQAMSTGLIIRLAVVAIVIGGIGVVTWQKSINSVRAAIAEGQALEHFREGDFENTLKELDKAISLAPGVPNYYNNRAQIYLAYQLQPDTLVEPGCDQQNEYPYLVCLGVRSLESNLVSVDQQPFNYRSRMAAANSAFNLNLHESAIDSYSKASGMVPNSYRILNDLAESQINAGRFDEALAHLDQSLGITGDSIQSVTASFLQSRALAGLGRYDEAIGKLQVLLTGDSTESLIRQTLDLIHEIDVAQGIAFDTAYFDRLIERDFLDPINYYRRGLAHLSSGNTDQAYMDFEQASRLGVEFSDLRRGVRPSVAGINQSVPALFLHSRALAGLGRYDEAIGKLQVLLTGDSNQSLIRHTLDLIHEIDVAQGIAFDTAYFDRLIERDFLDPINYYRRGLAHLSSGNPDQAYLDFEQASQLGVEFFDLRANKAYALLQAGDLSSYGELAGLAQGSPENPQLNAYLAEIQMALGDRALLHAGTLENIGVSRAAEYDSALSNSERAKLLAPDFGLPYLIQARILANIGESDSAEGLINDSARLTLPTARHYADRALLHGAFGNFNLALNDLGEAIRINPDSAERYHQRALMHTNMSNLDSAMEDLNSAIQRDTMNSAYLVSRGVLYEILGETERSIADFDLVMTGLNPLVDLLKNVYVPSPAQRDLTYFSLRLPLDLIRDSDARQAHEIGIDYLSRTINLDPTDPIAHYLRGLAYFFHGNLNAAIDDFDASASLGLMISELRANKAYAALMSHNLSSSGEFISLLKSEPDNGLLKTYLGEYHLHRGLLALQKKRPLEGEHEFRGREYAKAFQHIEEAVALDPNLGLAHLIHARLLIETDREDSARTVLTSSADMDLPTAIHYLDRSELFASLGETDLSHADLTEAQQINADLRRRG